MTKDFDTGAMDERREEMYIDEEHQMFLLTGQYHNDLEHSKFDRRAYVSIKSFESLPPDIVVKFREAAKPIDAKSKLTVSISRVHQSVSVYDGYTQISSSFPLQMLSQEIQDRYKKGPDAFERKFMPA